MLFREVVGQSDIKSQLKKLALNKRIGHAMLFSGPSGNGKFALALALAQYIHCQHPLDGDACGECSSCKKVEKLVHPDLHFVFPVVKKDSKGCSDDFLSQWRSMLRESPYISLERWLEELDAGNKQPIIYSAESDNINRKVAFKPYEGRSKVVMIWMPEKMHVGCANKLLKTLEEPPKDTYFILISEDSNAILPTIYSRTQNIKVPKLENNDVAIYLQQTIADPDQLKRTVHLAQGSIIKANQLLEYDKNSSFYLDTFISLMRLSYSRKITPLMQWADGIANTSKEMQKGFLEFSAQMIRENFIYNLRKPQLNYMTKSQEEFSSKFCAFINEDNILIMNEIFDEALRDVKINGNPKIIFTHIAFMITKFIR